MKLILGLILCLSSFNTFAYNDNKECLQKYEQSTNPDVKAAGTFLWEALDDCDYPSMDVMVKFIRGAKEMPAWTHQSFEDPLNCSIFHVINKTIDTYCQGKPWTLQKIQAQLLIKSLPEHFANDTRDAQEIGWQD